ncbi:helix-turn-helix domain-containing protein [Streptomyces hypolithicus]
MPEHAAGNERLVAARVQHGWHTQEEFAEVYDTTARELHEQARISVRQVRRWESGASRWPNRDARRVLTAMFDCPLEDLGFRRPARPAGRRAAVPGPQVELEENVRRRTFLGGVLAGSTPVFDLAALDHLTAAMRDARRYSDGELLEHLRTALDTTARADGRTGPHEALPTTLGILAAINTTARDAGAGIRHDLLILGSRGAELAAWLHRDAGAPAQATAYWHHQAKEWATLTGDGPMHAYVLLRQAQATDRDDPARMRDLAHAAANGPWTLPPRPRAEALQQEARALALTGADVDEVRRTLDKAHAALDQAAPTAGPATCTGPLGDSYTTARLMVQSAICYREAGESERAITLFQQHLATDAFAPRDRAFFTAHLAGALAAAGEPDEAANAALHSLGLAAAARFGQALTELQRTATSLHPYGERPAVRELHERLAALTAA